MSIKENVTSLSHDLLVPVCQGHHDVEGSKEEHGVKKGVAVSHALLLIIIHLLPILQLSIGV